MLKVSIFRRGKIDTFNTSYLYRRYLIATDGHLKNIAEEEKSIPFNTFYLYRRYLIATDGHLKNIAEYHFNGITI
jgi:hypothetical protein